jgi:hypothetical protein
MSETFNKSGCEMYVDMWRMSSALNASRCAMSVARVRAHLSRPSEKKKRLPISRDGS